MLPFKIGKQKKEEISANAKIFYQNILPSIIFGPILMLKEEAGGIVTAYPVSAAGNYK